MKAIKDMARMDVRYLFAEPSGIVIPFELRNSINMAARDVAAEPGPVVVLLNSRSPDEPFNEFTAHITRQQLEQSDIVALTGVDSADPATVGQLAERVREVSPEREVHRVGFSSREGVADLLGAVLSWSDGKEVGGPN